MSSDTGYSQGRQPGEMKSHLVIRLKPGWFYETKRRAFVTTGDETFLPWEELPQGAKIIYMTPDLAEKPPESLSEDERLLARYLQVIFPRGSKLDEYLALLEGWECIEEVRLPPEISLP